MCVLLQHYKNEDKQHYAIKFCVKRGEGAADTYRKIQKVFSNDSVSCAEVFWWHRDFVNGQETMEDEPRFGCPASVRTSTNVGSMKAFIDQD
jgi:hypothetical protein